MKVLRDKGSQYIHLLRKVIFLYEGLSSIIYIFN